MSTAMPKLGDWTHPDNGSSDAGLLFYLGLDTESGFTSSRLGHLSCSIYLTFQPRM
jgi:hypothetical protein